MHRPVSAVLVVVVLLSFLLWPVAAVASPLPATQPPPGPLSLDRVPLIDMPPVDNAALLREEQQRASPGVAPRFALPIPVDLSPANSGRWETLADGTRLWRLRLRSAGALSLNLGFGRYHMPEGGQLRLYTPDGAVVRGPFTAADNEAHGQLWTPLLTGEEIVVEAQVPAASADQLVLNLTSVNHGFVEFGHLPTSGSCNLDVVCGAADGYPQVDAWRDQIRAVAAISTGGSIFCTGFLVNNTAQDLKPYFMTANHCGVTVSNAPSLVTYWNFQNSVCRPPGSPASGGPGDGSLSQFNTGAFFRATYSPSDFTLVELDDPINPAYNVHWAGWDATSGDATSAVGIHHPNGDEKRISFEDQPTTTTSYLGTAVPGDGTHVRVIDWDLGTTEPGSSGSPLFNQDHRIVGQLHGGYAACGNNDSDWYGRFSVSWNGGGSSATRLKDWLDPLNSGALTLDGRDQSPDFTLTVSPTAQNVCLPGNAQYTVTITSRTGFADPVTLSASGNPGAAAFSPNPVTPPPNGSANSLLTVSGFGPGAYPFAVVGVSGSLTHQANVTLAAFSGEPGATTLLAPADGSTGQSTLPTFTWSAASQAASYRLQVATDPGFANLVINQSGLTNISYTPAAPLAYDTVYYWRVVADNACGAGSWSSTWAFRTAVSGCTTYPSSDVPQLITDYATVDSLLTVPDAVVITDVDVHIGRIDHTWDADLDIYLLHPDATSVELSTDNGGSGDNFVDTVFDDEASTSITAGSAPFTGRFQPEGSLAALDGKPANGVWRLRIGDDAGGDTGTLHAWSLTVCSTATATPADYSDLASSYGVARHTGNGDLRLGPGWTADSSFAAGADDASDDGLAFPNGFAAGQPATVRATVQGAGTSGRWLRVWFDWNSSGSFEAGELAVNAAVSAGDNDFSVAVPTGLTAAVAYRARLFDSAGPPPGDAVGDAAGGEVEDGETPAPCAAPAAVTGVAIAAIGGSQVQVTWNPATGADHYEVWYAANTPYFLPGSSCASPAPYTCQAQTSTTFTHTAMGDPATNYSYAVRAVSACDAVTAPGTPRVGEFEFGLTPGGP